MQPDADESLLGRGADTGDGAHGHGGDEVEFVVGVDDPRPVGLGGLAGELGEELRRAHAHRGGQPLGAAFKFRPEPVDALGEFVVGPAAGFKVDERLVEAERLHPRGDLAEEVHDDQRRRAVGREPAAEEGRVPGASPGLGSGHGGADPELPGLVGGRRHDATRPGTADDDGLAPQRRLVALLDGRVERVEVEVEDAAHESRLVDAWGADFRSRARLGVSTRSRPSFLGRDRLNQRSEGRGTQVHDAGPDASRSPATTSMVQAAEGCGGPSTFAGAHAQGKVGRYWVKS